MAGAVTLEEITRIIKDAGFQNVDIGTKVVSKEYAEKWGLDIDLQKYLFNGTITAYKI